MLSYFEIKEALYKSIEYKHLPIDLEEFIPLPFYMEDTPYLAFLYFELYNIKEETFRITLKEIILVDILTGNVGKILINVFYDFIHIKEIYCNVIDFNSYTYISNRKIYETKFKQYYDTQGLNEVNIPIFTTYIEPILGSLFYQELIIPLIEYVLNNIEEYQ